MERNLALDNHTAQSALQNLSRYYRNGLVVWSVLTLLFTVIPGVFALVNCYGLRRCQTEAERQRKTDAAFDWCLVGTLLVTVVLSLARAR